MVTQEVKTLKQWMNVQEVAEYLGLKASTIYQYVAERRIPHHKVPGSNALKFKLAEIEEWMESGRVETRKEYFKRSHKKKGNGNGTATQENGPGQ